VSTRTGWLRAEETRTFGVVALQCEQLLEMGLTVVLACAVGEIASVYAARLRKKMEEEQSCV
jgi:hypothetical protein